MLLGLRVNKHNPFVGPVLHTISHCLYGKKTFCCKHKIADVNSLGQRVSVNITVPPPLLCVLFQSGAGAIGPVPVHSVRPVAVSPGSRFRCLITVDFIIMGQ